MTSQTNKICRRLISTFAIPNVCKLSGFLLLLFCGFSFTYSQNLHQWGAISLFHGLPSDKVRAIAQDKNGVLWFGTENGLAKFDGRRVQTFSAENFTNAKIFALKFDAGNVLWIGTENGAFRLNNQTFSQIPETANKVISAIFFDQNQTILASEAGEIFECLPNPANVVSVKSLINQQFTGNEGKPLAFTSLAFGEGKILVGTQSRGVVSTESEGEIQEIFSSPKPYFINALERDAENNLWLGANAKDNSSGLFLAENFLRTVEIGVNVGKVLSLKSSGNDLWVGTEKNGVFLFQNKQKIAQVTFENTSGGLRSNTIYTIYVDREGVVWFGTDKGVCRFDALSPNNQILSEDAESNFARTIFQTKTGETFVGTNRGLYNFETFTKTWKELPTFSNKTIYAIGEDTFGKLLIGAGSDVFQDSKQINEKSLAKPASFRAFQNFQNKTYLAHFGSGLEQLENGKLLPISGLNFSLSQITSFDNQADKKLWIGTAKDGVFSFDGKVIRQENSVQNLRGSAIWDIESSNSDEIWFAAETGLFKFQNDKLEQISDEKDIRQIVVNQSDIWCATEKNGLLHLRFDDRFGWLKTSLNVEQGLPSQQIFALLQSENSLLIGTNRGISFYSPSQFSPTIVPAKILSQRLHETGELADGINLEYPQNSLLLEVTGLSSRTFPEKFQYVFLLRNEAGEVVQKKFSNEAQLLMENLRAGKYHVEVSAINQDLLVSAPFSFEFSIAKSPFPWTSTALGILLGISLIALLYAFWERLRLAKTNQDLTKARLDLADEAENERRRIARDLHDQTLADLRQLMLHSDDLSKNSAHPETNSFRREIENVSNEIRRICEDLSPSVLENIGLNAALEWLISSIFPQDSKIKHEFIADENLTETLNLTQSEQMQIYRIAQEVLNNIYRHAEAKFVGMQVEFRESSSFVLKIENDGKEFDVDSKIKHKGRGVNNIRSRASLINADISWEIRESGGMMFTLKK